MIFEQGLNNLVEFYILSVHKDDLLVLNEVVDLH